MRPRKPAAPIKPRKTSLPKPPLIRPSLHLDPEYATLSADKVALFAHLESSVFGRYYGPALIISGAAGVGKSLFARLLARHSDVLLLATTATAARLIGARTVHSALGLVPNDTYEGWSARADSRRTATESLRGKAIVLIDECSTMSPAFATLVSHVLDDAARALHQKTPYTSQPFGRFCMVFVGDFFQLPPVDTPDDFLFEADAVRALHARFVYLTVNHRQTGKTVFQHVLEALRFGVRTRVLDVAVRVIERRRRNIIEYAAEYVLFLFWTNREKDEHNARQLREIRGETRAYPRHWALPMPDPQHVMLAGEPRRCLQSHPPPAPLELKVGTHVVLRKNINFRRGLVNGALGIVAEMLPSSVKVFIYSTSETVEIHPVAGADVPFALEGGSEVANQVVGLPFEAAWAVTVYRAQGMTLPCVVVDLTSAQRNAAYVAVSRTRALRDVYATSLAAHVGRDTPPKLARFLNANGVDLAAQRQALLDASAALWPRLRELMRREEGIELLPSDYGLAPADAPDARPDVADADLGLE